MRVVRAAACAALLAMWGLVLTPATLAAPGGAGFFTAFGLVLPCSGQGQGEPPRPPAPRAPGEYYAIDLVPTGRVPGTATARGTARVSFADSPFGVAVSPTGSYRQSLQIRTEALPPQSGRDYVVWAADSELEHITRLGTIGGAAPLDATVELQKFLIVVSLEPSGDAPAARWQGPIVMRGMSRSGLMHTLAGHGPFQLESCLKYGYGGRP